MLATVLVLALIVAAFWKGLLRLVIAALVVLLVVGGVQAAQTIGAVISVPQSQCVQTDQNHC